MNKNDRSLLLGMLLGDGCLKTKHHTKQDGSVSTYYEYVLCHSIKQRDYLEHKLNIFHRIMGGKKPKIHEETSKLGKSVRFSRCHKSFKLLHKYLYSYNNRKYFTTRVLNYLTPEAIAIWYMDDGGVKPSFRPDGTISSCQMVLSTYCDPEQADLILRYFHEKWGIKGLKKLHKKSNSWYLVFNTKEGKKLEETVSPYIIPSMLYKLPSYRITRVLGTQTDCAVGDDIV
jgi:recombination protein RecA